MEPDKTPLEQALGPGTKQTTMQQAFLLFLNNYLPCLARGDTLLALDIQAAFIALCEDHDELTPDEMRSSKDAALNYLYSIDRSTVSMGDLVEISRYMGKVLRFDGIIGERGKVHSYLANKEQYEKQLAWVLND